MSVGYVAVQWNRHKRLYDACLAAGVVGYLAAFWLIGRMLYPPPHAVSDEILIMRALATCAGLLLHVILCIGPLARLDRRFLPLLYNRRHLGVTLFVLALLHAAIAVGYYHGFGIVNPIWSLLTTNTNYGSVRAFPFQTLGLLALFIFFLMAATSHDYWLKNLGAAAWKRLHMLVYVAYALVVMHVALGILQTQHDSVWTGLVCVGVGVVIALHVAAGWRERRRDRGGPALSPGAGWVDVGGTDEFCEGRGRAVAIGDGERIAVFKHQGRVYATTNVCAHQGGPLGEGRIIDGCITCPWHGWQYRPKDGCSPPPFTERIATLRACVKNGRVEVDPAPLPPGTAVAPIGTVEVDHA